jgi:hypothetical protein
MTQALIHNSDHPFGCTCPDCKIWWIAMGPQGIKDDGTLDFGPFSEKVIAIRLGATGAQRIADWREQQQEPTP